MQTVDTRPFLSSHAAWVGTRLSYLLTFIIVILYFLTCVAKYRIEPSHVGFNHFNTLQKPVNIKASALLIIHIWSNTSVTCVLLTVKHNFQKCVKPDI